MAMEDIMKALMQSAMQSQQGAGGGQQPGGDMLSSMLGGLMDSGQQASQPTGAGDMLSGVLGGLMGGGQQQAGSGDMLSGVLGGLMGGAQPTAPQQSGSGDMLSGLIGSLLGGGQQAGGPGDQLLGGLEQIIGGQPGTGQFNMNQGAGYNMGAMNMNNPVMGLLQPVVNQVAAKLNISPQIATVVASIALHYLLSSHSSTSPQAPMNLGAVMQQLGRSGNLSQSTLRSSGMVNDVMRATGLDKQQAIETLDTTFGVMGASVKGTADFKRG